jgi:hypothetical protein
MRRGFALVAAASFLCGGVDVASAASLNWEGTSTVVLSDLPQIHVRGGGVASVNGSAGAIPAHLNTLRLEASRGQVRGTQTVFVTDPQNLANGIAAVIVEAEGGSGTFAPISGGASSASALTQNVLPVRGVAKICILTTSCETFLALLLTQPTLTVNGAPGGGSVGVGVGGLITAGGGSSPIRLSLQAAPWTIKSASAIDHVETTGGNAIFTPITSTGFAHGPASGTTSTVQPSGVVQLVTPNQLVTNLPFGSSEKMAILVSLGIHFIPEPGPLLLLGSGVVGLGILGRTRMRR